MKGKIKEFARRVRVQFGSSWVLAFPSSFAWGRIEGARLSVAFFPNDFDIPLSCATTVKRLRFPVYERNGKLGVIESVDPRIPSANGGQGIQGHS
jgi:hypothetical protein